MFADQHKPLPKPEELVNCFIYWVLNVTSIFVKFGAFQNAKSFEQSSISKARMVIFVKMENLRAPIMRCSEMLSALNQYI